MIQVASGWQASNAYDSVAHGSYCFAKRSRTVLQHVSFANSRTLLRSSVRMRNGFGLVCSETNSKRRYTPYSRSR